MSVDARAARESLHTLHAGLLQAGELALKAAIGAAVESGKRSTIFEDRTGETRGSIRGESLGFRGSATFGGASRLLDSGTRAHLIEARGTALRFVVNGAVLYRRMAHHPGTAERPFVRQAREAGAQALEYGLVFFSNYAVARA